MIKIYLFILAIYMQVGLVNNTKGLVIKPFTLQQFGPFATDCVAKFWYPEHFVLKDVISFKWLKDETLLGELELLNAKNGQQINVKKATPNESQLNFSITGLSSDKSLESIFTILYVECKNIGTYSVEVKFKYNKKIKTTKKSTFFNITDTSALPILITPAQVAESENTYVNLTCWAEIGKPTNRLQFIIEYKNGTMIRRKSSKISIPTKAKNCTWERNITTSLRLKKEFDRLHCESKDEHDATLSIYLHVIHTITQCNISVNKYIPENNSTQFNIETTDDLNIDCTSDGYPTPTLSLWFKPVQSSEFDILTHSGSYETTARLKDTGDYYCEGIYKRNKSSETEAGITKQSVLIRLEVTNKPISPALIIALSVLGSLTLVICVTVGIYYANKKGYTMGLLLCLQQAKPKRRKRRAKESVAEDSTETEMTSGSSDTSEATEHGGRKSIAFSDRVFTSHDPDAAAHKKSGVELTAIVPDVPKKKWGKSLGLQKEKEEQEKKERKEKEKEKKEKEKKEKEKEEKRKKKARKKAKERHRRRDEVYDDVYDETYSDMSDDYDSYMQPSDRRSRRSKKRKRRK